MKTVAVILALLVAGFFWYDHFKKQGLTGRLPVITDPYYAEIRATNNMGGREIELALFARARNEADCLGGTKQGWANIVKTCPTCTAQAP